ncbi:MAG: MoaD/ThiS family protein, partial [Deltaproteobacteria bacterium]
MNVTLKLFATFRTGRFTVETREYVQGKTVRDVIEELSLPEDDIGATLINGIHVEEECELKDADTL